MSRFLVYFETKNSYTQNYGGFEEVGQFHLPPKINAGTMLMSQGEYDYKAFLISDFSGHSANGIFLKGGSDLQTIIIKFIEERLKNDCVKPHLIGFIVHDNSNYKVTTKFLSKISINQFHNCFRHENFLVGNGFEITK